MSPVPTSPAPLIPRPAPIQRRLAELSHERRLLRRLLRLALAAHAAADEPALRQAQEVASAS